MAYRSRWRSGVGARCKADLLCGFDAAAWSLLSRRRPSAAVNSVIKSGNHLHPSDSVEASIFAHLVNNSGWSPTAWQRRELHVT